MQFYERIQKWRRHNLKEEDGVLVAAEISQEWLLPWWWQNYQRHNAFPVAFADLGLSASMQKWCRERGELIPLPVPDLFVSTRDEIDPTLASDWLGGRAEKFWEVRAAWFKKPLACLQTPFQRTLWIDLDCEIRAPLAPLFPTCENPSGIAMVRYDDRPMYNSGVISFKQGNRIFEDWARESFRRNHLFRGDQELLTALIVEQNLSIRELPPSWNWSRMWSDRQDVEIYHWHGDPGKKIIYNMMTHL